MMKFGFKLNKYLLTILGVLVMAFSLCFGGLIFNQSSRPGQALQTTMGEFTPSGSWTDYTDGADKTLSGGTQTEVFINTIADLAWACQVLNVNTTEKMFLQTTFIFTQAEYDFSAHYWTPMGTKLSPFYGRFTHNLGEGKKVKFKNVFINNTENTKSTEWSIDSFGLLGYVVGETGDQGFLSNFEIENLQIDINTSLINYSDNVYIGGFVGNYAGRSPKLANASNIDAGIYDCVVRGAVNVDLNNSSGGASAKNIHIGGLAGFVQNGSTVGYNAGGTNNVTVTVGTNTYNKYNAGGLVGLNEGRITGITLNAEGKIDATNLLLEGGVTSGVGNIGLLVGTNNTSGSIDDIVTSPLGRVAFRENCNAGVCGGGIAGVNLGIIEKCDNYATISTYLGSFGGIAGSNQNSIKTCRNYGPVMVDGTKANTYGAITLVGSSLELSGSMYLGGIAGENKGNLVHIVDCTNEDTATISGTGLDDGAGGWFVGSGSVIGGITGFNDGAYIAYCLNKAPIGAGMSAYHVGGLAGINHGFIEEFTPQNFSLALNHFNANYGNITGYRYVGGLAGLLGSEGMSTQKCSILKAYNTGNVFGINNQVSYVGGIVGWVKNCGPDTEISTCFNSGIIGSDLNTCYAGGIAGSVVTKFVLKNCANYSDIIASVRAGGLIGSIETGTLPTFETSITTGKVTTTNGMNYAGGLIGYLDRASETDLRGALTSCSYDLGVAGYDEARGGIIKFPMLGNAVSTWTMQFAPLTINMTAPNISQIQSYNSYQIAADAMDTNRQNWICLSPVVNASFETRYYPILKTFFDAGVIGDRTLNSAVILPTPSRNIVKVQLINYLPTHWEAGDGVTTTGSVAYNLTFIDIYPGLTLQTTTDTLMNSGQYVIEGQRIARPTRDTNYHNRDDYYADDTQYNSYYIEQNLDGLEGKYWTHPGYEPTFVLGSQTSSTVFDFATEIRDTTTIYITHTAKTFMLDINIYNDTIHAYTPMTEDYINSGGTINITYTMEPGATVKVEAFRRTGHAFNGWLFGENGDKRQNQMSPSEWTTLWSMGTLDIPRDNIEYVTAGKLSLYGMFIEGVYNIRLHAGTVQKENDPTIYQAFFATNNSNQFVQQCTYNDIVNLEIPTFSGIIEGYIFSGYYTLDGQKITGIDAELWINMDSDAEYIAHWEYIIQTVTYVSLNSIGQDVTILEKTANFGSTIDLPNRLSTQLDLDRFNINYSAVEPSLDPLGYTFAGCFTDNTFSTLYDFEASIITGPTKLYIKWDIVSFTLKLNANIGKDKNDIQRAGGWGGSNEQIVTLSVPYNTDLLEYLKVWQLSNLNDNVVACEGFTPVAYSQGNYYWSKKAEKMGEFLDETETGFISLANNNYLMPALNNYTLYIIWNRNNVGLNFHANGGYFADNSITKHFNLRFEYSVKEKINELEGQGLITAPLRQGFVFKHWSLSENGPKVTDSALMPAEALTVYAVYGELRVINFYVLGARPENKLYTIEVPDGATAGDGLDMTQINLAIDTFLRGGDPDAVSAFELDYWVEMTFDDRFNITENTEEFRIEERTINQDYNLLAVLKPNDNYVAPNKDTTNYIVIAGIVAGVALILLFVVLITRPNREAMDKNRKTKNKDIQSQLEEIRELERRRRDMDRPYD